MRCVWWPFLTEFEKNLRIKFSDIVDFNFLEVSSSKSNWVKQILQEKLSSYVVPYVKLSQLSL